MNTKSLARQTKEEKAQLEETMRRIARHQEAGRFEDAIELLDELALEYGDLPKIKHYKGMCLVQMGEKQAGHTMMREALELDPEDPIQLCDIGTFLAQDGKIEDAIPFFRTATEVAPNYGIAQSNLGGALVLQKKYGEAILHLEKACELEPNLMDAHTNLSTAYMQTNNFGKAVDILFKALAIDPQSIGGHIQLSAALYRKERYESAEHHARRAIELAPTAAEAYLHLGNALASAGKIEEAIAALLPIAGRPPVGIPALSRLIHLRKTKADSPEMAILSTLIDRIDELPNEAKASVHFAAGKAFDDQQEYATAIGHFNTANAINNDLHPFKLDEHDERAERLRTVSAPEVLKNCAGKGVTSIAPIFISGMPRSGTTMMDQMFSRHKEVQAGGELRAMPVALHANKQLRDVLEEKQEISSLNHDVFKQVGETYESVVRAEGLRSARISDKMPSNFLYAGIISVAMPRAKMIIMRRHPLDNLLSNYFQHFGQNQPFSADFANMAGVYKTFDLMAKHWVKQLPDQVREVSYEDVTADPEGVMKDVLAWADLEWDPEILNFSQSMRQVNTASIAQVREPINRRAVARWKSYAPYIGELASHLKDHLNDEDLAACGVTR